MIRINQQHVIFIFDSEQGDEPQRITMAEAADVGTPIECDGPCEGNDMLLRNECEIEGVAGSLVTYPALVRMMEEDVWQEHPRYEKWEWKAEVSNDDTILGYWEWVQHRLEEGGE